MDIPTDIFTIIASFIKRSCDWRSFCLVCKQWRVSTKSISSYKREELENHLWKLIEMFPNKFWYWEWVSQNPNITMEIIEAYPSLPPTRDFPEGKVTPWNWDGISRNPNITMEIIEAHPEKPWKWEWVSSNPKITMEFIEAHPEIPLLLS